MTTFAFPAIKPTSSSWGLRSNTAQFISPLTGAIQTLDRGGEHWRVTLAFAALRAADRAVMAAFLAKLNGQQHRFTLPDISVTNRGAFGGTPLVAGAGQTGVSLNIDGASNNITNWIREGDRFGVDGDFKMCTADANSDGGGLVTISFTPRMLTAPPNNDPIVTAAATGVFMLASNDVTWRNMPGDLSSFSMQCVEDILA